MCLIAQSQLPNPTSHRDLCKFSKPWRWPVAIFANGLIKLDYEIIALSQRQIPR